MIPTLLFLGDKQIYGSLIESIVNKNINVKEVINIKDYVDAFHQHKIFMVLIDHTFLKTLKVQPELLYNFNTIYKPLIQVYIGEKKLDQKYSNTLFINQLNNIQDIVNQIECLWIKSKSVWEEIHNLTDFFELKFSQKEMESIFIKDRQLAIAYEEIYKLKKSILWLSEKWETKGEKEPITTFFYELRDLVHNSTEEWNMFTEHFTVVYPMFFKTLHEKYPTISTENIRICAYLKMGLTNKEISKRLHIQPDSVKKTITRIKKRMQLGKEETLRGFLAKV